MISVLEALESGESVTDTAFDQVYPHELQQASTIHWTNVDICQRVAELLTREGCRRILDLGSGPGKFCLVGALSTDAHFTGVEQRLSLVEVAREIVRKYRIPRVNFIHGHICDTDWNSYDGIYLYNPFYENVEQSIRLGEGWNQNISISPMRYHLEVNYTRTRLAGLASGTRVATFHGFGGEMPENYELLYSEKIESGPNGGPLQLWIKV